MPCSFHRLRLFGAMSPFFLVCIVGIACNRADSTARPRLAESTSSRNPSAIAPDSMIDQVHDFGVVIADPGASVSRRFRLRNNSDDVFKVGNVFNPKPCCIDVTIEEGSVPSGESIDVTLDIKLAPVGGRFRWFAVLSPAGAKQPNHRLSCIANVVPRASFELVTEGDDVTLLASERKRLDAVLSIAARPDETIGKVEFTSLNSLATVVDSSPMESHSDSFVQ